MDSTLFQPVRTWLQSKSDFVGNLITCHQCTGFWCGLVCGKIILASWNPFIILACGFAGSGLGLWSDTLLKLVEKLVRGEEKTAEKEGENNGE